MLNHSNVIFEQLVKLLTKNNAVFQIIEHHAAGKSNEVAIARGTEIGQGAKALVCQIKKEGSIEFVLAVLAADLQADLVCLAAALGGKKASLAKLEDVIELTNCKPGSIPPFSFNDSLVVVADPKLFERYSEIAFNAGTLEKSIILKTKDYLKICAPQIIHFSKANPKTIDLGEE